jgi:hypothetical protein
VRIPGGAAHTAGIAFTAGSAVMIMPSCMKSSKLLPTNPFGGRISSFVRTHGWPSTCTR